MPQQGGFKVEPQVLDRAAKEINEKVSEYETKVRSIYSAVEQLTVEWKGDTSKNFNDQLIAYKKEFDELASTLKAYTLFLSQQAAAKYSSTDSRLAGEALRLNIKK